MFYVGLFLYETPGNIKPFLYVNPPLAIIKIATNQRTISSALTSCMVSMDIIDPFSARGTNDIRFHAALWCGIFLYNKTPFAIGTSRRGFVFGGSNDLPILVTSILYHSQISSIAVLIKA